MKEKGVEDKVRPDGMGLKVSQTLRRAWVTQLLEEHRLIAWRHGVGLSTPVISLSEAGGVWGSWDAAARAIRISVELVRTHSWDVVLSVLKHEMAHQLAWERWRADGHGPHFQEACARLGVPPPFRSASGDLPQTPPDNQPGEKNAVLRKVEKLLALATSANEHEAMAATRKAHELLEQYNLDCPGQPDGQYVYRIIPTGKKRIERFQSVLCAVLMDHFFVDVVLSSLYDAANREVYRTIELLGRPENVSIAEYVWHFLSGELDRLWSLHRRKTGAVAAHRNSYRLGVLHGLKQQLEEGRKARRRMDAPESRALVPLADPGLRRFRGERFPRLKTGKRHTGSIYAETFSQGTSDGGKLRIHRALATADGFLGTMLEE